MIQATVTGTLPEVNLDFTDRMKQVAQIMEKAIRLNFMMSGRPASQRYFPDVRGKIPWEPLKPPRGGTPLVATGRFAGSVAKDSDSTSATVYMANHGGFSDPRIPWVHQMGTVTAGRNRNVRIPARPYMILTEYDIQQISETLMRDFIIIKNFK